MEYLHLVLKTQSCYGAVRFILSLIAFPTLIGFLVSFVHQDRLSFNCHPKPNDVAKQGCYFRYNDDTSALSSPLFFTGITCGILVVFWAFTVSNVCETLQKKQLTLEGRGIIISFGNGLFFMFSLKLYRSLLCWGSSATVKLFFFQKFTIAIRESLLCRIL